MGTNIGFAAFENHLSLKILWVDLNPVINPFKIMILSIFVSCSFMRKIYIVRSVVQEKLKIYLNNKDNYYNCRTLLIQSYCDNPQNILNEIQNYMHENSLGDLRGNIKIEC